MALEGKKALEEAAKLGKPMSAAEQLKHVEIMKKQMRERAEMLRQERERAEAQKQVEDKPVDDTPIPKRKRLEMEQQELNQSEVIDSTDNPILQKEIDKAIAEAANRVNCNGYFILRKDKDMIDIFTKLLNRKIFYLANLYYKYGFEALYNMHLNYIKNNSPVDYHNMYTHMKINIIPDYAITKSGEYDSFAILSFEDKMKFIDNVVIRSEERNFIFKYVDKDALPDILQKKVVYNDGSKAYSKMYIDTLKRLWVSLKQIECYHPEYLDTGNKLLLSDSFYIDNSRFVLYNRDMNVFIVMTNTFNSYVLNKDDAIKFYKENYGIDVIIDSVEINTEADEVPDFDIEEFSNNYELYYGSNSTNYSNTVTNNIVITKEEEDWGVAKVDDKDINTNQVLLSDGFNYNIENAIIR